MSNRGEYKKKEDHRKSIVVIRLTKSEKNTFQGIAEKKGDAMAKIARDLLKKAGLLTATAELRSKE